MIWKDKLYEATLDELVSARDGFPEEIKDVVDRYIDIRSRLIDAEDYWRKAAGSGLISSDIVDSLFGKIRELLDSVDGVLLGWVSDLSEEEIGIVSEDLESVIESLSSLVNKTLELGSELYGQAASCFGEIEMASAALKGMIRKVSSFSGRAGSSEKGVEGEEEGGGEGEVEGEVGGEGEEIGEVPSESMSIRWYLYPWRREERQMYFSEQRKGKWTAKLPAKVREIIPLLEEFLELQEQIDRIIEKLKPLQERSDELKKLIASILEAHEITRLELERMLVELKVSEVRIPSYKSILEGILPSMTEEQRKNLERLTEFYTTVSKRISLKVTRKESLEEWGFLGRIWEWLKGLVYRVIGGFRSVRSSIQEIRRVLKSGARESLYSRGEGRFWGIRERFTDRLSWVVDRLLGD